MYRDVERKGVTLFNLNWPIRYGNRLKVTPE